MKRFLSMVTIGLVIGAAGPAIGEMYYWTDENGIRHYSNYPPPPEAEDVGTASEIRYDAASDRLRTERDARAADEMRKTREAEEAEALEKKAEENQAAEEEKRRRLEAKQRELEKDLYKKRRYAHGEQARLLIQKARQLNQQIEALEKSGGNEAEIASLKAEKRQIAEVFYRQSRRWGRGGEADLKEHQRIQEQLDEIDKEK
jgi:hypothetical protein